MEGFVGAALCGRPSGDHSLCKADAAMQLEFKMIKVSITNYSSAHQSAIRRILERIGWAEPRVKLVKLAVVASAG